MKTVKLYEQIQELLIEVGQKLVSMRSDHLNTGHWKNGQFISEADLIANKIFNKRISSITPDIPILSEEDLNSHSLDRFKRYWLLDPIDGTASFCNGYDGFVTQIALMEGNQPVFGAVHGPVLNSMYVSEKGAGAYLNGTKLKVCSQQNKTILTDNYPEPKGIAKTIFDSIECCDYLESGSIGLKICLVADNSATLFVKDIKFRDWDLAPAHLILSEAGGLLMDTKGNNIDYTKNVEKNNGLIASCNVNLAKKVLSLIRNNDSV